MNTHCKVSVHMTSDVAVPVGNVNDAGTVNVVGSDGCAFSSEHSAHWNRAAIDVSECHNCGNAAVRDSASAKAECG